MGPAGVQLVKVLSLRQRGNCCIMLEYCTAVHRGMDEMDAGDDPGAAFDEVCSKEPGSCSDSVMPSPNACD